MIGKRGIGSRNDTTRRNDKYGMVMLSHTLGRMFGIQIYHPTFKPTTRGSANMPIHLPTYLPPTTKIPANHNQSEHLDRA
jgi:hypothetical protein